MAPRQVIILHQRTNRVERLKRFLPMEPALPVQPGEHLGHVESWLRKRSILRASGHRSFVVFDKFVHYPRSRLSYPEATLYPEGYL